MRRQHGKNSMIVGHAFSASNHIASPNIHLKEIRFVLNNEWAIFIHTWIETKFFKSIFVLPTWDGDFTKVEKVHDFPDPKEKKGTWLFNCYNMASTLPTFLNTYVRQSQNIELFFFGPFNLSSCSSFFHCMFLITTNGAIIKLISVRKYFLHFII